MDKKIAGKTKFGEIDIDDLAGMQPCMSRVMRQYTERYAIMYHACRARNWKLGLYQLKEIREIAAVGAKTRPRWKQELDDFDSEYLVPIEKAMKKEDWEAFERAYTRSTDACNELHRRIGYGYIKYRLPEAPPDWLDLSPE